jgi:hypothetical protein
MAVVKKQSKLKLILMVYKDTERKSIFKILYELLDLFIVYREIPVHYFSRFLFKKEIKNVKDYLPNKFLGNRITPVFNDQNVKEVLDNKLFFDFYYRQFQISLPTIHMYNHNRVFVIGKKFVTVNSVKDFIVLLEEIFAGNSPCDSVLIKKTYASSGGSNILMLLQKQLYDDPETVNEIYAKVIKSEFIFQEIVRQHPDLNKLNSSCLNTLRMDTFTDRNGKIEIISSFIRMSISNSYVDNVSSGGCSVSVDLETGRLKKYGYSMFVTYGPEIYTRHPVTNVVFENFKVPMFNEAKELVLKTAGYMPGLRLVGWDVAISEDGPVIIEGNSDYEIRGSDFAYGGYLTNKTFRKVLHEINYLDKELSHPV